MHALLLVLLVSAAPDVDSRDPSRAGQEDLADGAGDRRVRDFGDQGKPFDAGWGGFCTYWFCGAGPGGLLAWAVSSWIGSKRIPLLPMVLAPGAVALVTLLAAGVVGGACAVPGWFYAVSGLASTSDAEKTDHLGRAAALLVAGSGATCCLACSGHLCTSIVGGVVAARGGRGTVVGENELEFDLWSVPAPTYYDEAPPDRLARPYDPSQVLPAPSSLPAYVPPARAVPVIIPPPAGMPAREFHVLLNGRDISSLTSLSIDEASVAIDDAGNIFIEAGGFDPAAPSTVDVPGTRANVFLNGLAVDAVRSVSFPRCRVTIDAVGIHLESTGVPSSR